jgi:hypothetical protein
VFRPAFAWRRTIKKGKTDATVSLTFDKNVRIYEALGKMH